MIYFLKRSHSSSDEKQHLHYFRLVFSLLGVCHFVSTLTVKQSCWESLVYERKSLPPFEGMCVHWRKSKYLDLKQVKLSFEKTAQLFRHLHSILLGPTCSNFKLIFCYLGHLLGSIIITRSSTSPLASPALNSRSH